MRTWRSRAAMTRRCGCGRSPTGQCLRTFEGHTGPVYTVRLSADARLALSRRSRQHGEAVGSRHRRCPPHSRGAHGLGEIRLFERRMRASRSPEAGTALAMVAVTEWSGAIATAFAPLVLLRSIRSGHKGAGIGESGRGRDGPRAVWRGARPTARSAGIARQGARSSNFGAVEQVVSISVGVQLCAVFGWSDLSRDTRLGDFRLLERRCALGALGR
jgi:hypothetical protein